MSLDIVSTLYYNDLMAHPINKCKVKSETKCPEQRTKLLNLYE